MMREAVIPALLLISLLLGAVVHSDATIVWNGTGTYIQVSPLTGVQSFEGISFNAYYVNGSNGTYTVRLWAVKYLDNAPYDSITFTLYALNGTQIGNYTANFTVSREYNESVTVPSNITIIYITMGGNVLGPYYISYVPIQTELPSELRSYAPLIPLAFLIAFAARGRAKDVAFGLLAYAVMVVPICSAFGYSNPVVPILLSMTAFLAFVVLYVSTHK